MDPFYGALLLVCGIANERIYPRGTAFMIGPGLALTARHVVEELVSIGGFDGIKLFATDSRGKMQLWRVTKVTYPDDEIDIAILYFRHEWKPPRNTILRHFELSARVPPNGTRVSPPGTGLH